ncbi:hypothetical protein BG011_002386, partial [Mortierella polycephala]
MTNRHNAPDVLIQTTPPVRAVCIKTEKDGITFGESFSEKKRALESDDQSSHVKGQCATTTAMFTTLNTSTSTSQSSAPSSKTVRSS